MVDVRSAEAVRVQAGAANVIAGPPHNRRHAEALARRKATLAEQALSGLCADISGARPFLRRLLVEAHALSLGELIEAASFHRASMEEPLLAAIISNEPESTIPHKPFNRAVRHVD
jgi:hypothetical protein